ncbi:hypothetical protein Dacet_0568 [Denitrovibrio acetiphilus DSM 12809]|uniref:DUF6933 domain-containing protein n=1 Tax=Denitrovibrio acetiphilus (strain DSM 12809 / NBRC 114555 / N2460) TaxID=522772 RepID=D4H454_DENA2|nr:hypothetical protein [Denitrovibrio acetiphilus]ADD67365.1 hypothetical protein Dacet_0568 [Denitrovibrio acetiphilus DSM 12809]
MLHFNLTKQMYEKLIWAGTDMSADKIENCWHWHMKIITFGRMNCVLAVEEETRYAIVILDLKKAELKDFQKYFMIEMDNHLSTMFMYSDKIVLDKLRAFMTDLWDDISYSKPISRSVSAHMTQMEYEIDSFCHRKLGDYLPASNIELQTMCHYLNERLRSLGKKHDYHIPMDRFRNKVLELIGVEFDNVVQMDDFR